MTFPVKEAEGRLETGGIFENIACGQQCAVLVSEGRSDADG